MFVARADHVARARRVPRARLAALALLAVVPAACGTPGGREPDDAITVFAASSLTVAFTEVGEEFTRAHPEYGVTFNFAGSTELATQISEGAPVDVFAAADGESMTTAIDGRSTPRPRVFARNALTIAVPSGNPASITGLADLTRDDVVVVLCDEAVPCGRYTRTVLDRAGLTVRARSLESSVKAVVTKIALGEADAGLVYATDVDAVGSDVDSIEIPEVVNARVEYPIVAVSDATGARAFVEFVLSASGQDILVRHGFRRA